MQTQTALKPWHAQRVSACRHARDERQYLILIFYYSFIWFYYNTAKLHLFEFFLQLSSLVRLMITVHWMRGAFKDSVCVSIFYLYLDQLRIGLKQQFTINCNLNIFFFRRAEKISKACKTCDVNNILSSNSLFWKRLSSSCDRLVQYCYNSTHCSFTCLLFRGSSTLL